MNEPKPSEPQDDPDRRVRVVIVSAATPTDDELRDEFVKHLAPLIRDGEIALLHSGLVVPGQIAHAALRAQLAQAELVLLLASSDLVASYDEEIHAPPSSAVVVHVRARAVDWIAPAASWVLPSKGSVASRANCVFRSTRPPVPPAPGHPFRSTRARSERSDGPPAVIGAQRRDPPPPAGSAVRLLGARARG